MSEAETTAEEVGEMRGWVTNGMRARGVSIYPSVDLNG